jgi:hypothetical protein
MPDTAWDYKIGLVGLCSTRTSNKLEGVQGLGAGREIPTSSPQCGFSSRLVNRPFCLLPGAVDFGGDDCGTDVVSQARYPVYQSSAVSL